MEIAGEKAVEGLVIGSFFNPNNTIEKTMQFIETFQNTYGKQPSQYAVQGYDAVYLLVEAIQRAKSAVPEKLASSLRSIGSRNTYL